MNESEILISEVALDKFLDDKRLDKSFKQYFCKPDLNVKFEGLSPMPYYRFDESVIRDSFLDSDVKTTAINLIRRYSVTPKYNKIGTKCDELVYRFICDEKKRTNYAIDHPDKVNSLILIAAQYKMPKKLLSIQNTIFRFMPISFVRQVL